MLTAIIALTSIAQIILALFVYLKGRNNLTNRLFTFICLATLGWALTNYITISLLDSPSLIYVVRLILFCVVIQNAFYYLFARTFPSPEWKHSKRELVLYGFFSLLAAVVTLSPFVFTSVAVNNGLPITQAGPAILIFIAHATFSIFMAFKAFFEKLATASGVQKSQLRLLLLASFLTWVLVPITNFAITPLLKTTIFIVISPIYTLVFASIIAYTMVSQKLFDIQLIVARSVAYLLSLGTIVAIYGLLAFGFFELIFRNEVGPTTQRAFYIGFAVVSSILYQPIKHYFDRTSNRLFYQDAYDTQTFLDQLNKVLTSTIEIEILLRKSSEIINQNLKSSFCTFILNEVNDAPMLLLSKPIFKAEESEELKEYLQPLEQRIVVTEDLGNGAQRLKTLLASKNVAIVAQLSNNVASSQGVGILVLGYKNSGNTYTKEDYRNIDIVADELVIAIQNALRFEEIQSFNATLQEKINMATKELQRTNIKLKALDETKDEFISMASHQLRTPLTSVKGYLSMVLEKDAGELNPMQEQLLGQAFSSSQRMVYLIADLLNVSRLKNGKFILDTHPTNLADVVEGEITQLKETAKSKKLTVHYDKPQDFPLLKLDETKIRQVIMNFADNAIYYTGVGGKITVELIDTGTSIEFRVTDNGLGVPKKDQHKLFAKFYRAGNARKARPDGTGLGLFMARKVIASSGGALIFKSQEGKGSTFGFTFNKEKFAVTSSKNTSD